VAEKGFPEFLAAGAELCARFPQLHLLAIGHRLESERRGDRWQPEDHPRLQGRLKILSDRDDMKDLYACMDLHVLPSHREGFPRVLMEGAAAGLPQVATAIRGCRQTVEHGVTGFLVPVKDVGALGARMTQLIENADLRQKMGLAAREKGLKEFDQMLVFATVEGCYASLLQDTRRRKSLHR
jgi:glycosyltransferase involved in cell wall biosynthesis